MEDSDGTPIFAFHDLDYIPYGYEGTLAPYIETQIGTMRAAAKLMHLGLSACLEVAHQEIVICDLGCGDGYFLINLLSHINTLHPSTPTAHGIGIDYSPSLIASASVASKSSGVNAKWLTYNFNDDREDLVSQLTTHRVTHMFVYLVPKQLALQTVRKILTRLCESGVVVCCHKFYPGYLLPVRHDMLMELVVYDETS